MSEIMQKETVKQAIKPPSMWNLIFLNDDFTTVEFVVACAVMVCGKTESEGRKIASEVHEKGKCIVGKYVKDIALTKQDEIMKMAHACACPFQAKVEQDSE